MSNSTSETAPLQREEKKSYFILIHITAIARMWGVITAAVMWTTAIVMINHGNRQFYVFYLMGIAIVISFLEITWLLNKCACCGKEGCCCRLWLAIMWVDNWKRFLLYVILSLPLFFEGRDEWSVAATGIMLVILSTIYLVKTFQSHQTTVITSYSQKSQVTTGSIAVSQQVVTQEISTQTDVEGQPVTSNPFDE